MQRLATAFAIATVLALGGQAASAQTLKAVQDRGQLVCGANGTLAGFGAPDPQGNWIGFDVDICRNRGRDFQRSDQGEVCPIDACEPVYRFTVR